MSTEATPALQDLFDSYAAEYAEDQSGVRIRRLYAFLAFDMGASDEPSPVYVTYRGSAGRFYLGTSFELGIVAAADWADDLRRAGAPSYVIEEVADWLSDRAL